jgi:DDE superfamily endonuclease
LSLISTKQRRSFPISVEQVIRTPEERAAAQAKAKAKTKAPSSPKHKGGRPKGSTTKAKTDVVLNPELARISTLILALLRRIGALFRLTYLVLDGHFGTNAAVQMALRCQLQLISKLRFDSALFLPYEGPYAGHGPHRIYGDKLNPRAVPQRFLRQTTVVKGLETCIYQLSARHKSFGQALNVVVIVKTNLTTQAQAHVILFSSDLALLYEQLIDYYCLRFQLEISQLHYPHTRPVPPVVQPASLLLMRCSCSSDSLARLIRHQTSTIIPAFARLIDVRPAGGVRM